MSMMGLYESVIDKIAVAAPPMQSGDYMGEDGLMYCGKCRTRRQTRVDVLGTIRTVPVMCQCMIEAREAEQAREKAARIERARRISLMEEADAACTFENDDRKNPVVSDAMRRYADGFRKMWEKNIGLLLYGPVGTGKSFFAACVANALLEQEVSVKMTNFTRIINDMQAIFEGRQEYLNGLNRNNLLIIDDLGVERESEYMQEQVYNIIDARYRAGRPLIVTTNIPLEEIKNPKNMQRQRIYDRVLELCHPVKIDGTSRRRRAVIDHYAERNRLLGI
ncbi:ATP-binding protein [Pseudoflavonifractor sp. MCC625]|uniref:ATP-binding protein n=1 Tax=Pseudoflavonifractor sp. MCC625 TaxID=2592647 RepID=UPI003211C599